MQNNEKQCLTNNEKELKTRGLIAFLILISVISIGGNLLIYRTQVESEETEVIKLGFIFIDILVLSLLTFVSVNYLSHPTCWSEKMVCRGRTLEYLTVILIVGIILVLALVSEVKLSNDTVGTILGTIAGYVLGRSTRPKEEEGEFKSKSETGE